MRVQLRRGFKAEANRTSRELRAELGLAVDAPLCPFRLAEHLGVPALRVSSFLQSPEAGLAAAFLLSAPGLAAFSATMLCIGAMRVIIFNDGSSAARVASDIAHELSHLLLLHPAHRLCTAEGGRHYDAELEAEANWMGPALLVSDEAAVSIARRRLSVGEAAGLFGVSEEVMRMRLNTSAAYRRAA